MNVSMKHLLKIIRWPSCTRFFRMVIANNFQKIIRWIINIHYFYCHMSQVYAQNRSSEVLAYNQFITTVPLK